MKQMFVNCEYMDLFCFWMPIFNKFKPQACVKQLNYNLLHAICDMRDSPTK